MLDGVRGGLAASDVGGFRRDLLDQASDEGVTLDITEEPEPGGTVRLTWHVQTAAVPVNPPERLDPHALAQQAQTALTRLLQQAANEVVRQALRRDIASIASLLETIGADGQANANGLNELGDTLANAAATADPRLPASQGVGTVLQQIGDGLGASAQTLRGPRAVADDTADTGGLLRHDGAALFASCVIRPERRHDVQKVANRIVSNAAIYHAVSARLGGIIPWFLIGIIHSLESSFSFTTHLHNGDTLAARTTHVPRGRPAAGHPPFSWQDSAADALQREGLDRVPAWPLPVLLDRLERYNGAGYVGHGINSPYLWSFSQHWTRGKFVGDRVFDSAAGSDQCGGAVALKQLVLMGAVQLTGTDGPLDGQAALGHGLPVIVTPDGAAAAELAFPGLLREGSDDVPGIRRVQEWCSYHRAATPIDGGFGEATTRAVQAFQARAGIPPTGEVDERTWSALTAPLRAVCAALPTQPASLGAAVVAVAAQHIARHPIELGGDNRGPWVRLYMDGQDGIDEQWCAGFACFVIAQAAHAMGAAMPFRREVGVSALIADAKRDGRFVAGRDVATPAARQARLHPGCLFVIKTATQSHTGIVTEVGGDSFVSAEGNTFLSDVLSGRGFEAVAQSRHYANLDFVLLA